MQECGHTGLFELHRLIRTAAGDDGVVRGELRRDGQLFIEQFLRREAEQTDTPRPFPQEFGGASQQDFQGFAFHHRQGDHGHRTALGNGQCEFRGVGHARHRSLNDGEAQTHGARQRRVCRDNPMLASERSMPCYGAIEGLKDCAHRPEALRPRSCKRDVLADGQERLARVLPGDPAADPLAQFLVAQALALDGELPSRDETRTHQQTEVLAVLAVPDGQCFTSRQMFEECAQAVR